MLQDFVHLSYFFGALFFKPHIMTSSNGNIFHVTGHLCGEFTGQLRGAFMFSLICARINRWANNREAGDLRRYRAQYDVTVMLNLASLRLCTWHKYMPKTDVHTVCALLRFLLSYLNVIFTFPTRIFHWGVPGSATDCRCGVLYRGLTIASCTLVHFLEI